MFESEITFLKSSKRTTQKPKIEYVVEFILKEKGSKIEVF